ncbi:HIG1 domain-containing protein [Subtercola lobariae]|uniref:HIG1 domain-containing protein n=1 Tax=Subtercola lobariae TaxID=1588641 RepID=A0A917B5S8_9MICO|nr:HIG1 domain-containing protein [Subtercola lobariae]GGF24358.1 hypothetical protein GCM10011399_17360 [Subtercola lobariae]
MSQLLAVRMAEHPELALTGLNPLIPIGFGVVVLILGLGAYWLSRRRPRSHYRRNKPPDE